MKHLIKFTFLLLALLFASCKKNELDLLPAATATGANTMGAIVNGKAWVANGGTGFQPPKPVEGGYTSTPYDETGNNVYIQAYKKDKTQIHIYLRNVSKTGEYLLDSYTKVFGGEPKQPQNYGIYYIPGKVYMTTSEHTGKVIITRADTTNGIISGVFHFTAVHGAETTTVTNGRFDMKF
ncbi:DUF6252 family protein [Pontibacter beigongshangensis]|uniref:DUF6252 family protein n=1 Tax=Pontibacter beigongshangensis TaxID=2574733 RepID=UPI00164F1DBE|nr:DUF6252 family protein [Pontibacter beigongshangensis]